MKVLWLSLLVCLQVWAQSSYYFPFAPDGGVQTTLLISNPGVKAANVAIAWTNDDASARQVTLSGLGQGSQFSLTLAPGASRILQTSGGSSDSSGAAVIGSDQVLSVWGVQSAYDGSGLVAGETGFAPARVSTGFRVPVDSAPGLGAGIALYNPGPGDAAITASLVDASGAAAGSSTLTLAAGARATRWVSGDLFADLGVLRGTLDLNSTAMVAAQAIRKSAASPVTTVLDAPTLASKRMKFYLPRLADGPSTSSTLHSALLFTNLSKKPANVTVRLAREDGSPWTVAIPGMDATSTFQTVIAPGASTFWQTDGTGAFTTGAASIKSDAPIGVQALVTSSDADGATINETAVYDAGLRQQFTLPFDITTEMNPGAAFYNPGSRPVTLTLSLMDQDGNVAGTTQLAEIAPGAQISGAVADFFPGTPVLRGTLSVNSGDGAGPFISALGVRQNSSLPWPAALAARAVPLTGVPIAVATTSDGSQSVNAAIGPQGGTLSLTDASGNQFTLTIPPNALFATEQIVMTPVSAAEGLPGSGLVAVKLEPDGLHLMQPATLAIVPATPPDSEGTFTPVGWYGLTPGVYLNLLQPKADQFTTLISHFSYGGGSYFKPGDLTSVLLSIIDIQAYYQSEGTAALAQSKKFQEPISDDFYQAMDAEWEEAIEPLIGVALATQDDDVIRCATEHALNYARQRQLMGTDEDGAIYAAVIDFAAEGLQIAMGHAQKRCTQDHDFTALQDILSLLRQQQLVGGGVDEGSLPDFGALEKECPYGLEFEFTSKMVTNTTTGFHYKGQISSKFPLYGDWDKEVLTKVTDPSKDLLATYKLYNSGPEKYDNFSLVVDSNTDCSITTAFRPGQLSVVPSFGDPGTDKERKSQVQFMFSAGYDPSPYSINGIQLCAYCPVYRKKLKKVDMLIDVGLTWEDVTVTCPDESPGLVTSLWWMQSWTIVHPAEIDYNLYNFFPNWQLVVSSDLLAQKKSGEIVVSDDISVVEETTMKLNRTPPKK